MTIFMLTITNMLTIQKFGIIYDKLGTFAAGYCEQNPVPCVIITLQFLRHFIQRNT